MYKLEMLKKRNSVCVGDAVNKRGAIIYISIRQVALLAYFRIEGL